MKKLFFFIIFAMMTGSVLFAQQVFQTNTYALSPTELNNLTASYGPIQVFQFNTNDLYSWVAGADDEVNVQLNIGDMQVSLLLSPFVVKSADYRTVVHGGGGVVTYLPDQSITTFKGHAVGDPAAKAYFYISENLITGVFWYQGEKYVLAPYQPNNYQGVYYSYQADNFIECSPCGICDVSDINNPESPSSSPPLDDPCDTGVQQEFDDVERYLELAADSDYEFYTTVGANTVQSTVAAIQTKIMVASDGYFMHYFNMPILLTEVHVRTENEYPYNLINSIEDIQYYKEIFKDWWNQEYKCTHRDIAHLFSGKSFSPQCGTSFGENFCNYNKLTHENRYGYSISEQIGGEDSRYQVVAHEILHNFGIGHSDEDGGVCPDDCESEETASVMCSEGCSGTPNNLIEAQFQNIVWAKVTNLPCLQETGEHSTCSHCFVSASIDADNKLPLPDCMGTGIIHYTVTVCNDCDANTPLTIRVYSNEDRETIIDNGDFPPPTDGPTIFQKLEISDLYLEPAECKEFHFTTLASDFGTTSGYGTLLHVFKYGYNIYRDVLIDNQVITINGTDQDPVKISALIDQVILPDAASACSAPQPKSIMLNGVLEIDVPEYCFGEGTRIMTGEGAVIRINSGSKLNLNEVEIKACQDKMWKGIEVAPEGFLAVSRSLISDAQYAIKAPYSASVEVTNTTFDANDVGIYIPESMVGIKKMHIILWGNVFDCTYPLKTPFEGQQPLPGSKGYAGVFAHDIGGINITGYLYPETSALSIFRNLLNGIVAYNTNLSISNTIFSHIIAQDGIGDHDFSGRAIYAKGQNSLLLTGLGGDSDATPSFDNCDYGIWTHGLNLDISNNHMINVGVGIKLTNNLYRNVHIHDNEIRASIFGIQSFNNYLALKKCVIENNFIDMNGESNSVGIFLADFPAHYNYGWSVSNNVILLEKAIGGIHLSGSRQTNINDNYIQMDDPAYNAFGINIESTRKTFLQCNTVSGAYSNTPETYLSKAIKVIYAPESTIQCNTIGNTDLGIQFSGSCDKTRLRGNHIYNHQTGLLLGLLPDIGDVVIGNQLHQGNEWNGSYEEYGAAHLGEDQQIIFSNFSVNGAENSFYLPSVNINFWFINEPSDNTYQCLGSAECSENGFTNENESLLTEDDKKIALGEVAGEVFMEAFRWNLDQHLLERIQEYPDWSGDSDITDFIQQIQNSSEPSFVKAGNALHQVYNLEPQALENSIIRQDDNMTHLFTLQNTESALQSQFSNSPIFSTLLESDDQQNILTLLNDNSEKEQDMYLSFSNNINGEVENLLTQLNNLEEDAIFELNQKALNLVLISHKPLEWETCSEEELKILYEIANQCPLSGGEAVLSARGILTSVTGKYAVYDDENLCGSAREDRSLEEEISTPAIYSDLLKISPNPAGEDINIEYMLTDESGSFILYDARGEKVLTTNLAEKSGKKTLSLSRIPAGIYFGALYNSRQALVQHIKLSIIH